MQQQRKREVNKKLTRKQRLLAGARADVAQKKFRHHDELADRARLGSKEWHRRAKRLRKKLKYLKAHQVTATPSSGVSVPDRPWNPYRRPIANWMIPWIDKSWAAGWRGVVVSGWRDPAYSESLCFNICGAPSCSGTCAGRNSGHSQSTYPGGCIDVTDQYDFQAIQYRIGSPLRNDLPSDRVHFSITGH